MGTKLNLFPKQIKKYKKSAPGTKICNKHGGEPIPIEEFSKKKSSSDGRNEICKACMREYGNKRYAERKKERENFEFTKTY